MLQGNNTCSVDVRIANQFPSRCLGGGQELVALAGGLLATMLGIRAGDGEAPIRGLAGHQHGIESRFGVRRKPGGHIDPLDLDSKRSARVRELVQPGVHRLQQRFTHFAAQGQHSAISAPRARTRLNHEEVVKVLAGGHANAGRAEQAIQRSLHVGSR